MSCLSVNPLRSKIYRLWNQCKFIQLNESLKFIYMLWRRRFWCMHGIPLPSRTVSVTSLYDLFSKQVLLWVVTMNVPQICNWNWAQGLLGFNLSTNSWSDLPDLFFSHFNHAIFIGLFIICPWFIRILSDDDKDESISLEKEFYWEIYFAF